MKYAKELREVLRAYPLYVQQLCISYKKWKQTRLDSLWRTRLYLECLKANLAPRELWDTNVKTLYKICKRLQKKYDVPAKEYYYNLVRTSRFRFTYQARETLLPANQKM